MFRVVVAGRYLRCVSIQLTLSQSIEAHSSFLIQIGHTHHTLTFTSPLPLSGQWAQQLRNHPTLSHSSPSMHGRDCAVVHGWYCNFKVAVWQSAKTEISSIASKMMRHRPRRPLKGSSPPLSLTTSLSISIFSARILGSQVSVS